jgi:hypothetical protein
MCSTVRRKKIFLFRGLVGILHRDKHFKPLEKNNVGERNSRVFNPRRRRRQKNIPTSNNMDFFLLRLGSSVEYAIFNLDFTIEKISERCEVSMPRRIKFSVLTN